MTPSSGRRLRKYTSREGLFSRHYRDHAELFLEVKKEIAECGLEEYYWEFLFLESIISKKGQIDPAKYRGRNLVGKPGMM